SLHFSRQRQERQRSDRGRSSCPPCLEGPRAPACGRMNVLAVSHIAIGVTDMERALKFYRDVLGLRVDADWRQRLTEDEGRELHGGRAIDRRCVWLRWGDGPYQSAINLDELRTPQPADRRADIYD